MRVISNRIISMDMERTRGKIIEDIKEIERITRCTEQEPLPGQTAGGTKESMYTIKSKGKENQVSPEAI